MFALGDETASCVELRHVDTVCLSVSVTIHVPIAFDVQKQIKQRCNRPARRVTTVCPSVRQMKCLNENVSRRFHMAIPQAVSVSLLVLVTRYLWTSLLVRFSKTLQNGQS